MSRQKTHVERFIEECAPTIKLGGCEVIWRRDTITIRLPHAVKRKAARLKAKEKERKRLNEQNNHGGETAAVAHHIG